MQLVLDRRPDRRELVEIQAHRQAGQILVGVQDDLEAVAVHPPARMAGRDLRQAVGGLKAEPVPQMGLVRGVQVGPLVAGAADADGVDAGHGQALAHPAGQVFIGRDRQLLVQVPVVQWGHARLKRLREGRGLTAREGRPVGRERGAHAGGEAVPMQAPGAVPGGEDGNAPGGLEGGRGQMEEVLSHARSLLRLPSATARDRPAPPAQTPWPAVGRSRTRRRGGHPRPGHSNCW